MHRMILCRSQTDAMSIVRLLTSRGISAFPARPPRGAKLRSCSWGVKLTEAEQEAAEKILLGESFKNWRWM